MEMEQLVAEAEWTDPSQYDIHGVAHGRSTARLPKVPPDLLTQYVDPPIHNAWFAKLDPGGFVIPHIDGGVYRERWHIPLQPAGFFWEDGRTWEITHEPFQVRHWLPHAVWNPTDRPRIHLMIERDVQPDDAPKPGVLEKTEMLPEIQALIDDLS